LAFITFALKKAWVPEKTAQYINVESSARAATIRMIFDRFGGQGAQQAPGLVVGGIERESPPEADRTPCARRRTETAAAGPSAALRSRSIRSLQLERSKV
jgi:hypothetical protein